MTYGDIRSTTRMTGSTLSNNEASLAGGVVMLANTATCTMKKCTMRYNSATNGGM